MNLIKKRQPKDIMTHRQYETYKRTSNDTAQSNNWLRKQGLDEYTFTDIHIRLLDAQRQAHELLKGHRILLSAGQVMSSFIDYGDSEINLKLITFNIFRPPCPKFGVSIDSELSCETTLSMQTLKSNLAARRCRLVSHATR